LERKSPGIGYSKRLPDDAGSKRYEDTAKG
jgi:hypothetical protein